MDLKPLIKQEREEISRITDAAIQDGESHVFTDSLFSLIAAEAFWREAVKKSDEWIDEWVADYHLTGLCFFCKSGDHKPDCPWKLAQE